MALFQIGTSIGLKQKLHLMWAADATLNALQTSEKLFTGRIPSPKGNEAEPAPVRMPYTRLATPGGSRGIRTSDTEYPLAEIKFYVWTETSEEGDEIANAIVDCYADAIFDYSNGKVTDTRFNGSNQEQITMPNYTAWKTTVGFTMRLMRQRTR